MAARSLADSFCSAVGTGADVDGGASVGSDGDVTTLRLRLRFLPSALRDVKLCLGDAVNLWRVGGAWNADAAVSTSSRAI